MGAGLVRAAVGRIECTILDLADFLAIACSYDFVAAGWMDAEIVYGSIFLAYLHDHRICRGDLVAIVLVISVGFG